MAKRIQVLSDVVCYYGSETRLMKVEQEVKLDRNEMRTVRWMKKEENT